MWTEGEPVKSNRFEVSCSYYLLRRERRRNATFAEPFCRKRRLYCVEHELVNFSASISHLQYRPDKNLHHLPRHSAVVTPHLA